MNLGIFTGRLGRDSETATVPNGDTVCNFSIAVEIGTKANPRVMWVECSLWGKRGESIGKYLVKGTKVSVAGRIGFEEYTKHDKTNGYRFLLNVNDIDMHSKPEQTANAYDAPKPTTASAPATINDDDLPF